MSLTVGAIVLGFAVALAIVSALARQRPLEVDFPLYLIIVVLWFARGPEAGYTYLAWAAYAIAAILLVVAYRSVPRHVLRLLRAEHLLTIGLAVAIALSAFVVPDTHVAQRPILIVIIALGTALIVTGITHVAVLTVRAWRKKPESA